MGICVIGGLVFTYIAICMYVDIYVYIYIYFFFVVVYLGYLVNCCVHFAVVVCVLGEVCMYVWILMCMCNVLMVVGIFVFIWVVDRYCYIYIFGGFLLFCEAFIFRWGFYCV